jgi:ABC-type Fe3+/spermidine/putrescine transport system ATPase subunit
METELGNLVYDGNNINELEIENIITIRPENIKISDKNEYDHNSFKGTIKSVIFSGTHTRYKILIDNIELECSLQSVGINNIKENDEIYVHLPKNKIWGMND